MARRPRLLDLFCGAGGCSVGYDRAGFDVVGVDIAPQPRYPFEFYQGDAMHALELLIAGRKFMFRSEINEMLLGLADLDAIHASPPCQAYTVGQHIHGSGGRHPDLVEPTRELLEATGKPWVVENVPGSPLRSPAVLCGLMFGLRVLRHRLFETNWLLLTPPHPRHPRHLSTGTNSAKRGGKGNGYSTGEHGLVSVAGNNFVREAGAEAMGIDWMRTRRELANAIPPAYTLFVGNQLFAIVER